MPYSTSIRAVIFDCFGVIYEDAFKEFIEHYLPDPNDLTRRHYYDMALAADRGLVADDQFYDSLSALSGVAPAAIQHRLRDSAVLNRQVVALARELQPRYQIGMLSNAERSFLDRFLDQHDLRELFTVTLASSETSFVKPQRGIFDELTGRLGLPAAEIIFIDDSPANTAAAARYGFKAVHYQTPTILRRQLDGILKV